MKQKKTIKLFVIFLILFLSAGFIIGIYSTIYSVHNHLDSVDLPAQSKLIIGIIILFIFDPLLLCICWSAKCEHQKTLLMISLVFLLIMSTCAISEIVEIIPLLRGWRMV